MNNLTATATAVEKAIFANRGKLIVVSVTGPIISGAVKIMKVKGLVTDFYPWDRIEMFFPEEAQKKSFHFLTVNGGIAKIAAQEEIVYENPDIFDCLLELERQKKMFEKKMRGIHEPCEPNDFFLPFIAEAHAKMFGLEHVALA